MLRLPTGLGEATGVFHCFADARGKGIANPIRGAMMLAFLGDKNAHDAVLGAIEQVLGGCPHCP